MQLTINLVHYRGQILPLSRNLAVKLLLEKAVPEKRRGGAGPESVTPKSRAA